MSAKHTPGPWRIGHSSGLIVWDAGGRHVVDLTAGSYLPPGSDENRANVRLIAAAPGLLAACEAGESALGENLVWLADALDLRIRQGDAETLRRLAQLNAAWVEMCKAIVIAKARGEGS